MKNNYQIITNMDSKRLPMILWSSVVGLLAGIVVVAYRMVLIYAEGVASSVYTFLRSHLVWIPLWFIILVLMGYIIGYLVEKNNMISGSGIPQVKGILMGYFKNSWLSTLCLKFVGGTLAIIGGLSLGREGPSIQLGSCVAEGLGKKLKLSRMEKKVLIASGASAGLAAAFNAPLAGVMFAIEEIFKYFSPVILLSTMASAVVADFVSKQVFGISPVFDFQTSISIPLESYWILILLGAVLGAAGAFYNYILGLTQKMYKKLTFLSLRTKPIIAFVMAGVLGLVFPLVLGGGHSIIETLNLSSSISFFLVLLLIKFVFSMVSFGSGTPGGIFFPLLVMGAIIGAIFGNIGVNVFNFDQALFYNFVILAMAGYFTAIVRAPITGIILITEMTNSLHHLLSLTVVSITAYVIADLLKSAPIYDTLLENQLADKKYKTTEEEHSKKIMVDAIVQIGSKIANKQVKTIEWPKKCLLLTIKRGEKEILPNGDTEIKEGDYLIVITDLNSEYNTREEVVKLTTGE